MEFLVHVVVTAGLLMVVAYLIKGIPVRFLRVFVVVESRDRNGVYWFSVNWTIRPLR